MKKGCLITILLVTTLVIILAYSLLTAFEPEYDSVEIKQNIGGTLLCNSVYIADHHSWQYNVSYKYKAPNDNIITIGNGIYFEREWKKDEQLIEYKNWIILKTNGIYTAKIIVGDLKSKKWTEYEFTPETIEKDSLWKSENITFMNQYCPETTINSIRNGLIELEYKLPTNKNGYKPRKIYYKIDDSTGHPIALRIE